jgi:hypothetical protein
MTARVMAVLVLRVGRSLARQEFLAAMLATEVEGLSVLSAFRSVDSSTVMPQIGSIAVRKLLEPAA